MELILQKIAKENDKEFALFRVKEDCNLWPFILFDATYDENGNSSNLLRHLFIFPSQNVSEGDFVIVYTSTGENTHFKNKAGTMTWIYYWGLGVNIWNNKGDEALLIKVAEYKRYYYR